MNGMTLNGQPLSDAMMELSARLAWMDQTGNMTVADLIAVLSVIQPYVDRPGGEA